jgi:hypothetical protein
MQYDLGLQGLGILIAMSLIFGLVAQLIAWSGTHLTWLVSAVAFFIGGLFMSEVVFGTSTVDEIQPIIDGLALDEAALGGLLVGVPVALITWYLTRRSRIHHPAAV